jgi:D-serine deaminase-like pyridoxal phosphate-dependent protein
MPSRAEINPQYVADLSTYSLLLLCCHHATALSVAVSLFTSPSYRNAIVLEGPLPLTFQPFPFLEAAYNSSHRSALHLTPNP